MPSIASVSRSSLRAFIRTTNVPIRRALRKFSSRFLTFLCGLCDLGAFALIRGKADLHVQADYQSQPVSVPPGYRSRGFPPSVASSCLLPSWTWCSSWLTPLVPATPGYVIRGFSSPRISSLRHCALRASALIPIIVAFTIVGCSTSKIAPVSGRVTLDGKPLAGVHVGFQPIAKPGDLNPGGGSYAITDSEGNYTLLQVHGEEPGATIGRHRVEITAKSDYAANIDPVRRPPPKVFVPAKYSQNSELTFEVPSGGSTTANFDLKSQ
jgi:hypothetical protein